MKAIKLRGTSVSDFAKSAQLLPSYINKPCSFCSSIDLSASTSSQKNSAGRFHQQASTMGLLHPVGIDGFHHARCALSSPNFWERESYNREQGIVPSNLIPALKQGAQQRPEDLPRESAVLGIAWEIWRRSNCCNESMAPRSSRLQPVKEVFDFGHPTPTSPARSRSSNQLTGASTTTSSTPIGASTTTSSTPIQASQGGISLGSCFVLLADAGELQWSVSDEAEAETRGVQKRQEGTAESVALHMSRDFVVISYFI